jgi:hypothetical protein
MDFSDWCDLEEAEVAGHIVVAIASRPADLAGGSEAVADLVPGHYSSVEHIARVLSNLGKPAAAQFIRNKLPTSKRIRSGDLGEILATEYIDGHTQYSAVVKRQRWKDHRNMAMRGDDVIGVAIAAQPAERLLFLKAEAKSRAHMTAAVIQEARAALDRDQGLPSPHALGFLSARLLETGNANMADRIDRAQLQRGVAPVDVEHLLFVFSGNDSSGHIDHAVENYGGQIGQLGVSLRIPTHGAFIAGVYDLVIANADDN